MKKELLNKIKKSLDTLYDSGRAVVIVVNKWDAVKKDEKTMKAFEENIRAHFQFLDYAPIVFLSAKTRKRTQTLIPVIDRGK